jgi:hypothetical protein
LVVGDRDIAVECRSDEIPGLACARRGRADRDVGHQGVVRHVGADLRRGHTSARGEHTIVIARTRVGPVGLGVAKQHQAAHGVNIDFLCGRV